METGSCSRRCMPSLRSKATQRRRNVQGSGHGEWALSAAWRQKHRAAHAGRARTVATGSPRAWLLHGGSESRTGRGASHNASVSMAPAGSKVGVTGSSPHADAKLSFLGVSPQFVCVVLFRRLSSRATAVGCHVSPRGARMPRDCNSSAMPRTVVIPERLISSTIPAGRRRVGQPWL